MKKQQGIKQKKAGTRNEFPRIYRVITDRILWVFVASAVLLVLVSYIGLNIYSKFDELQKLIKERERIVFEINHWEKVVTDYKDYRDAYFKLAVLEYQMGESEKSKNYLKKTFYLDPNFEKGRELERLL